MAYSVGIPVVGANVVVNDTATEVNIGDSVTITAMRGAAETEVAGKVIAIELNNKPFYGERERAIYDGLPTSHYENLVTSMIRNAADVMEVSALLIEVPGEEPDGPVSHKRVNISAIREITKS